MDTSQLDVTHSAQISYSSENPQIATVDNQGIVTAVFPGSTHIIVSNASGSYYVSTEVGQLAKMAIPGLGSALSGSSETFQWTGSNNATAYRIQVGSTQGANNYYDSGSLPTTIVSQTVNSLPTDGSDIYVTLWTQIGDQWASNQYYYTAFTPAQINSPQKGSTLAGAGAAFTWTAESLATSYQLWIGSTANSHDIDLRRHNRLAGELQQPANRRTHPLRNSVRLRGDNTWSVQDAGQYTAAAITNAQIDQSTEGNRVQH